MNLRAIANSCIQAVNPNQTIIWRKCTGYTKDEFMRQVPEYTDYEVQAQIQSAGNGDLQLTDGMNLTTVMRKVYLNGVINGVNRIEAVGGDLLIFPEVRGGIDRTWLVTQVAETWDVWCSVTVVLQDDNHN